MDEAPIPATAMPPAARRERELGRLTFGFMLDQVATGVGGLSATDGLLVLAINQANIAPLTREPLSRIRYGRMEAAAPDARRRPVSINAVATSLGLPFETVRRRIRRLEETGACALLDGGVIVPESFLTSPAYVETVAASHHRLRAFYYQANLAGLVDELPRSSYPPEAAIPVRAAARLLSDFLLRTSAGLMAIIGDVVSVVVLLAVLGARTETSVAAIAQRLQLPAETVRRHVVALADNGHCERSRRGVFTPDEVLEHPMWRGFLQENIVNVQRLFAGLAERGVIEAWGRLAPPVLGDAAIPARSLPTGG